MIYDIPMVVSYPPTYCTHPNIGYKGQVGHILGTPAHVFFIHTGVADISYYQYFYYLLPIIGITSIFITYNFLLFLLLNIGNTSIHAASFLTPSLYNLLAYLLLWHWTSR